MSRIPPRSSLKLFSDRTRVVARLIKHGFTVLGTGCFSTVLAKGDSRRCIKVGTDSTWEPFLEWGIENGFAGSFCPKVYTFHRHTHGLFTAVMERLDTTVEKLIDPYNKGICPYFKLANALDCPKGQRGENIAMVDKQFPGFECFMKQALLQGFASDLHSGNWMLANKREDGTYARLVLIDPQSGRSSSGKRRWRPAGVQCVEA
jgi:hypothetical protein